MAFDHRNALPCKATIHSAITEDWPLGKVEALMIRLATTNPGALNELDESGNTPLLACMFLQNTELLAVLLRCPAVSVHITEKGGCSPLLCAVDEWFKVKNKLASEGRDWMASFIASPAVSVVKLLLAHPDVDVNVVGRFGRNALHVACSNNDGTLVAALLRSTPNRKVGDNPGPIDNLTSMPKL